MVEDDSVSGECQTSDSERSTSVSQSQSIETGTRDTDTRFDPDSLRSTELEDEARRRAISRSNNQKKFEKLLETGQLRHDEDCGNLRGGSKCDCARYAELGEDLRERRREKGVRNETTQKPIED